MKNLFLTIALVLFALNATAQKNGYTRIELSFVASHSDDPIIDDPSHEDYYGSDVTPKGVEFGVVHGINLTNSIPLFLETGGRIQWTHLKFDESDDPYYDPYYDDEEWTDKYNFLSLSIPAAVVYRFAATDKITIAPFFGPNFKFNLLGKEKFEYEDYGKEIEREINFFKDDKENMQSDKYTAKRFQFGLNLGVGFVFNKFYLGYRFQPDLTKYRQGSVWDEDRYGKDYKRNIDAKTKAHIITLGIDF